jgi:hypothetical protein
MKGWGKAYDAVMLTSLFPSSTCLATNETSPLVVIVQLSPIAQRLTRHRMGQFIIARVKRIHGTVPVDMMSGSLDIR